MRVGFTSRGPLFSLADLPYGEMFNEYFCSGLDSIVFQEIRDIIEREYRSDDAYAEVLAEYREKYSTRTLAGMKELQAKLRKDMLAAADALDFERAALLRDEMNDLSKKIEMKEKVK